MLLEGRNPYADWQAPYDVFVYGPVFADLFFPFAFFNPSIGNIVYNTLGATLVVLGIAHLPASEKTKKSILLYSFPLIAQSVFANQFNTFVAASFLWIYIFYVRKKDPYALALIAFSGLIKIYTLVALLLWLFRSDKWRHALWFLLFLSVAFCLPLLHFSWNAYLQLFSDWRISLSHRHGNSLGDSFFKLLALWQTPGIFLKTLIQAGSITCLALIAIYCRIRKPTSFSVALLWALCSIVPIFFAHTAEANTYVIGILGYAYYYYTLRPHKHLIDKILHIGIFVVFACMPIDILCPPFIFDWLRNTGVGALLWVLVLWRMNAHLLRCTHSPKI